MLEQFLDTGKLFLLVWGSIAAFIFFVAGYFAKAQGLKYGTIFGLGIGLVAANVAVLEKPHGILVVAIEAFVLISIGVLYVLATARRTHEVAGFGSSDERGLPCFLSQETPTGRALTAAGNAQIGIIGAQADLIDAETHRLTAEALAWAQQAEYGRLQLTGRDF